MPNPENPTDAELKDALAASDMDVGDDIKWRLGAKPSDAASDEEE